MAGKNDAKLVEWGLAAVAAIYAQRRYDALGYLRAFGYETLLSPINSTQAASSLTTLQSMLTSAQAAGRTGLANYISGVMTGIMNQFPSAASAVTTTTTTTTTGAGTTLSASSTSGTGATTTTAPTTTTASTSSASAYNPNLQSVDIMYSATAGYKFTTSQSYAVAVKTGVVNVTGVALPTNVTAAVAALKALYTRYKTTGYNSTGRVIIVEINWIKKHYPGAVSKVAA